MSRFKDALRRRFKETSIRPQTIMGDCSVDDASFTEEQRQRLLEKYYEMFPEAKKVRDTILSEEEE